MKLQIHQILLKLEKICLFISALNFDNCRILTKILSFIRLNMIFEGNNIMNLYNLRFYSSVRCHRNISNDL